MKLLMITGLGSARDLASGKRGAFYNTLEEFHKYWDRIDIIAPKIRNPKSEIRDNLEINNSKLEILFGNVYVHKSRWPLIFHPVWFLKKAVEIYKEQKFDIVTVQDFPPFYNGIGARLLWNKIRVPYVLEFHHIPGYPRASNLKEKIYSNRLVWKLYWKLFGSKTKAVRTVNQKQTSEFLAGAGIPKEKIVFASSIYLDLNVFKPMDLQKEYDIIFVGRLEKNKGIDLLLDAIRILHTKYKLLNTKTLIVGDGPVRDWVRSQIANYQLPITNFGWAKDSREVAELINKSKILIMPSYNEGGPRVVVEAMACGVPILATSVGLIPDFADKNAVKIIDWNADDIVLKIKELLENENERNRLSRTGTEIAQQFEKTAMVKNYANCLKKFLN